MIELQDKISHLRGSNLLRSASDSLIHRLAEVMETLPMHEGKIIFNKGERGEAMYIIARGVVRVHDGEMLLATLQAGEVFGEVGALASHSRTATVSAVTDGLLLVIRQDNIYDSLDKYPEAAKTIIQALCDKEHGIINDANKQTRKVLGYERELEIGKRIQQNFLPRNYPSPAGWDIAANMTPAKEVAGDFYDIFPIPSINRIAIIIGDVCDKGVGAALFMALFRSLLRSTALAEEFWQTSIEYRNAAEILSRSISISNNYVAETHRDSSMFASVFFALIDPETGEMDYINAGHEPAFIIRNQTPVHRISPTGPAIGLFSNVSHNIGKQLLQPGDLMALYTDGVTEAMNPAKEQFGDERLIEVLCQKSTDASATLQAVTDNITGFAKTADQHDDITLLLIQRQHAH